MTYFVYATSGDCYACDCDYELKWFPTLEEAEAYAEAYVREKWGSVIVGHGKPIAAYEYTLSKGVERVAK